MRQPVHLPQIGFGQDTATIVAWHRSIGETIRRGETIAEIEVEKTNMDVEVHASGTVAELVCTPGEEVAVGQVIAYIQTDTAAAPGSAEDSIAPGGRS